MTTQKTFKLITNYNNLKKTLNKTIYIQIKTNSKFLSLHLPNINFFITNTTINLYFFKNFSNNIIIFSNY